MQAPFNPTYDHLAVENAAQAHWTARDAYRVTEYAKDAQGKLKPKYYACSMLPYPSGKLHMGHVRNYTINDMMARQLRMKGFNVLMPMGWDAFGLPAENAAMKNNVPPAQWTHDNIAYMKKQMQAMGLAIDWSREIATCDPSYYKWNQWLFLKMLEKGIAYRKTQVVNWDPVDQTVLANEQVIDGKGWRTGAVVEKREIPGYYLNITQYAPELLDQVQNGLPGWPERVKLMQENWIGKSEGVRFAFPHDIKDAAGQLVQDGKMYVFTTRADTIMGVTFVAVAPEHPLAVRAGELNADLAAKIEALKGGGTTEAELATKEKEGVATGLFVTHPLSDGKVEIWVGNYVLMSYGDGAVMGVPAHDERDFAFAKKYSLPILQVIRDRREDDPDGEGFGDGSGYGGGRGSGAGMGDGSGSDTDYPKKTFTTDSWQDWYATKDWGTCTNSGQLSGLHHKAAIDKVTELLAAKNLGEKKTTWRLRDWGVSRQRYWGTPIPIIHCDEHGAVPVPEKDLPVVLPQDCVPDGSGNPLHKHVGFHADVVCPVCGKAARRETDTMDTFVDSSWYFMRYCDPGNIDKMVAGGTDYWMGGGAGGAEGAVANKGMDQYIGGIEHAILHLLYARFWTKVMRDLGLVKIDEPFTKLLCQGMVLNHVYSRKSAKGGIDYFWPHEVENSYGADGKVNGAQLKSDGSAVDYGGVTTMSKSKNNGVDPQDLIDRYGADTSRLYMMFTAPPEATLEWNDAAVEGSYKYLKRVWQFAARNKQEVVAGMRNLSGFSSQPQKRFLDFRFDVHSILKQISYDYERMQYNTVVSGCMKLLNILEAAPSSTAFSDEERGVSYDRDFVVNEGFGILLRCLYPAAPHIANALWSSLGYSQKFGDLLDALWPAVDEAALQQDEIELMLQINGKLRGSITVPAGAAKEVIEKIALGNEAFVKYAEGAAPKKVIVVPGRLVNVVV
jgi:leucyl-tRNA synthetase